MVFIMEPGRLRKLMNEALEQSNKAWIPNQENQPSMLEAPTHHPVLPSDQSMTEMDEDESMGGEYLSDDGKP